MDRGLSEEGFDSLPTCFLRCKRVSSWIKDLLVMASNPLSVALIHSLRLSSELRNLVDLRATDRWRPAVWLVALQLADFTGSEFWEACEAEKTAALGWEEMMTPRSSRRLFRHVSL